MSTSSSRTGLLVVLLLFGGCTSPGGDPPVNGTAPEVLAAGVDSVFSDIGQDAPGCAVGVYRNGELVLARGYGLANVEDARLITARTTFDLGSAAKQFTALTVLTLEEQRRLSLDDDVRRYVPELPDYGTPIRIRDLLQHTSGLRDYGSLDLLAGRKTRTMGEFLTRLSSQKNLNSTPGARHEYSHSDYELLSVIVERVTQQPFGAYVEREILWPLGMKNSRISDARGTAVPDRAFGHVRSPDGFGVVLDDSEIVGGGSLYTSIEDLQHWDRALAEGESGQQPLVSRMLTRPTFPNGDTILYAYGIRQGSYRGLPTISRGGHSNGMRSEIIRFTDQLFTVATLCNADHLWAGQRAEQIADLYLGDVMLPRRAAYRPPPEVPTTSIDLQRYIGVYRSPGQLDLSRIAVVAGKLVEWLGDTVQTFTYRGDGLFTADGIQGDFRLVFASTPTGGMQVDYMSEGHVDSTAERVADSALWRPDSTMLADYAGTYASEELDAVWEIAVRNGRIVLRSPGRPDGSLQPINQDTFSRHFGAWNEPLVASLTFARDSTGMITQFSITTPPGDDVVRNLVFLRLPVR